MERIKGFTVVNESKNVEAKPLTIRDLRNAVIELPQDYLDQDLLSMKVSQFRDMLVLTHPNKAPMVYDFDLGDWFNVEQMH